MNAEPRKNWWLGILLVYQRTSADFQLLLCGYFVIFLPFFFTVLFYAVILTLEGGGKTVVIHQDRSGLPYNRESLDFQAILGGNG